MELKDRIIKNATILFFKNGIKSVTMTDIAQDMGISKRTLYEVFKDKEELLESCLNTHINRQCQDIEKETLASCNIIEKLLRLHSLELNNILSVGRSMVRDLKKYHRSIYDQIQKKEQENFYHLIPLFNKGMEEGFIREDIPFEILIWLLKRQFRSLMEEDEMLIEKYSLSEYVKAIILNFLRGISTPLGLEKIDEIINKKHEVLN